MTNLPALCLVGSITRTISPLHSLCPSTVASGWPCNGQANDLSTPVGNNSSPQSLQRNVVLLHAGRDRAPRTTSDQLRSHSGEPGLSLVRSSGPSRLSSLR